MINFNGENGAHQPASILNMFRDANNGELYFLKSFLNSLKEICWITDETERLLFGNIALLNFFGLNTNVMSKSVEDVLPKDVARLIHEKFQQEWKHADSTESSIKMTSVSGKQHVFVIRSFKLTFNNQLLYGGIASDVSVQHHTEDLLFACNQKWLAFTHCVYHAVWEWDLEKEQLYGNDHLNELVGAAPGHVLNPLNWFNAISKEDQPIVRKLVQELLQGTRQSWQQEYRFITGDGKIKSFLDRGMVITRNEKPQKLIGFVLDVTDLKDMEWKVAEEKNLREQERTQSILEAQEQERRYIGQELHDNVAQIITTAKMLLDMIEPSDPNGAELKRKTSELVQQALDEIRAFSNELTVPVLKANGLHAAIEDLLADIKIVAPFCIRYTNDMTGSEKLESCKTLTLFRIIQEQVKNILKHAQATAVDISLRHRHGLVELEIKDDGIGFNPKKVRRGVGLTGIFERTQICNGNIKIDSELGKGTRLMVVFPE